MASKKRGAKPAERNPLDGKVGVAPACHALGVSRATFYRRPPARALCQSERKRILDVLVSPRFVDRSPGEVVATLLDEGEYWCSESTMWLPTRRYASVAINVSIRNTPSLNSFFRAIVSK